MLSCYRASMMGPTSCASGLRAYGLRLRCYKVEVRVGFSQDKP